MGITKKLDLTLLKLKVKRAKNTKKSIFHEKKTYTCLDRRKFPYNWLDNSVQDNPYLSVHFLKKTKTVFFIDLAKTSHLAFSNKNQYFSRKKKKKKFFSKKKKKKKKKKS